MRCYLLILAALVDASSWFGSNDPPELSASVSTFTLNQPHTATRGFSSALAQATREVGRALDGSKDYFYSSWDDSRLRKWLEEHGIAEARKAGDRSKLNDLASHHFQKASEPVWQSWSDAYMRDWLIAHGVLPPEESPARSSLVDKMKRYYYSVIEKVWTSWSNAELKAWLVNHGFLRSDVERQRDELIKMVESHYLTSSESIWEAWSDSDIREWLIANGFVDENIARQPRHELVERIKSKYSDVSTKTASYLTWPDARLRAYLREHGVGENALPSSRLGLLQETRVHWIDAPSRAQGTFAKFRDLVNSGVKVVEDALGWVCQGLVDQTHQAGRRVEEASGCAWEKCYEQVMRGGERMRQAKDDAGEKVKGRVDEL